MSENKFKYVTVTAVIVANMVGTGVFTSLGFQLLDITSGFALLFLWVLGGLTALCGAISYAELGQLFLDPAVNITSCPKFTTLPLGSFQGGFQCLWGLLLRRHSRQ